MKKQSLNPSMNTVSARNNYTDASGYTTGPLGKIMGGGGSRITVNPAHVTKV